jgi:hypothetical protein
MMSSTRRIISAASVALSNTCAATHNNTHCQNTISPDSHTLVAVVLHKKGRMLHICLLVDVARDHPRRRQAAQPLRDYPQATRPASQPATLLAALLLMLGVCQQQHE